MQTTINTYKRNQSPKQIKRCTMFMDWRTLIVKMVIIPKLSFRFNAILIKVLSEFCIDIDKVIQKFIWKSKRNRRAKQF